MGVRGGSVVMAAARFHYPGIAVLVVVGGITAALLILQSVNHRETATASLSAPSVAPSLLPVPQTPPAHA